MFVKVVASAFFVVAAVLLLGPFFGGVVAVLVALSFIPGVAKFSVLLAVVVVFFALVSGDSEPGIGANDAELEAMAPFGPDGVCRAVIGVAMNVDPLIMRSDIRNEFVSIEYNRPSDGSLWRYECRFSGNRIIWRSENGRWNDGVSDTRYTRIVDDNRLIVWELDGGGRVKHIFAFNQIVQRH